MDLLILAELKNNRPMGGYDITAFINNKFKLFLSPSTVYSTLYSMERAKLIKGVALKRKTVYMLTDKGKETIDIVLNAREKVQNLIIDLL